MPGKLVIAIKEREDEASQLNRLGETGPAPSLLQDVFVGAQSSVLLLSHPGSNDILTTLLVPVQVRASISKLKPLGTGN